MPEYPGLKHSSDTQRVSGERSCVPTDEPVPAKHPEGQPPAVYASRTELVNGGRSQSAGHCDREQESDVSYLGEDLDESALGAEESLECEATVLTASVALSA